MSLMLELLRRAARPQSRFTSHEVEVHQRELFNLNKLFKL